MMVYQGHALFLLSKINTFSSFNHLLIQQIFKQIVQATRDRHIIKEDHTFKEFMVLVCWFLTLPMYQNYLGRFKYTYLSPSRDFY